jgi:hypothetical protein
LILLQTSHLVTQADVDANCVAARPAAVADGDMATAIGDTSAGNEAANIRLLFFKRLIISDELNSLLAGGDGAIATAIRDSVNAYATNNDNGTFETLRYSATTGAIGDNTGALGVNESRKQHYKLVSGLLDNDKYLTARA